MHINELWNIDGLLLQCSRQLNHHAVQKDAPIRQQVHPDHLNGRTRAVSAPDPNHRRTRSTPSPCRSSDRPSRDMAALSMSFSSVASVQDIILGAYSPSLHASLRTATRMAGGPPFHLDKRTARGLCVPRAVQSCVFYLSRLIFTVAVSPFALKRAKYTPEDTPEASHVTSWTPAGSAPSTSVATI
jgi:hypothetical protein